MPKGSPGTGHGGRTVEVCRAIGEPLARQLGLLLWDVRFVKEGATWYLRYIIDKDGGVGIDDCVALTRLLNPALDRADPIAQSYCLEVTSPGMERELTRPEHFERYRGSPVRVTLIRHRTARASSPARWTGWKIRCSRSIGACARLR